MQHTIQQQSIDVARPLPGLVRAERSGLIDALIFAATAIEFYFLNHHFTNGEARPPGWLFAPAIVIWVLLMAGALAPIMRRPAAKPGELPRGTGAVLLLWGALFFVWLIILFNEYEEALWGFWHLARSETMLEYTVLVALVPITLAPCWRRLYRLWRFRILSRRRAAGDHRPIRIKYWPALAIAGALAYAYFMKDHAIWQDGWGILAFTRYYGRLEPEGFREPLFMLLFRDGCRPLMALGLNVAQAASTITTAAMLPAFIMLHLQMRRWDFTQRQMLAGWLLILSTLGMTQLALGHVELYPLLIAGIVGTLFFGLRAMDGRCSPAWASLIYAIVLAGHLSAVFILPAVLLMFWLRAVPRGRLSGPVKWPVLLHGYAHLLGWGLLIHGPLWFGLMVGLDRPTPLGIVAAVMNSLNTGAENLTFIGSDRPTVMGQALALLSFGNVFKVVQSLFYLAGGPLLACVAAALAWMLGWRPMKAWGEVRTAAVLWTAFLGYLVYVFTWHADWAWQEDWDLFSGIAPLALLLTIRMLMPARGVIRVPFGMLATGAVFALALSVTQHAYNHTRGTFMNRYHKLDYNRVYGAQIQRLEFEHDYPRFTGFKYEDGKVVAIPPIPEGRAQ